MGRWHYLGTCAAPAALPQLAQVLDQLGGPGPRAVARWCGVDERTARRWMASGRAPRAALLALWLATPSALDERAARADAAARLHAGLYESARREVRALQQLVDRLAPLARAGAANEPVRPAGPSPAVGP